MIPVEFTSEAEKDLFDAADYYQSKAEGLGLRFGDEIADILGTAANAPYLWRLRPEGYRRINCPVFPYYIAYIIRDDALVVVAIAASRRLPGYWHSRLK